MLRRKLIVLGLVTTFIIAAVGCGKKEQAKEKPKPKIEIAPDYYTKEADIPDDTYCIAHKLKDKDVVYYPLLKTTSMGEVEDAPVGAVATRFFVLNKNEKKLPTMYPGDKLIYKNGNALPDHFIWEKFYDAQYSIGIAGLTADTNNKPIYQVDNENTFLDETSNAREMKKIIQLAKQRNDDDAYVILNQLSYKKEVYPLDSSHLNSTGFIAGLDRNKTYTVETRLGTEKQDIKITSNTHFFTEAETYLAKGYDFLTDEVIRVNTPTYLTTGYYEINGAGAFRYLRTEKTFENIPLSEYNKTIYTYATGSNTPIGTADGLMIDENGYLTEYIENTKETQEEQDKDIVDNDGAYDDLGDDEANALEQERTKGLTDEDIQSIGN